MTAATDPRMIERLLREGPLPVTKATALVPPCRGRSRAPSTLVAWIERGKRGIRLEGYYGADKCYWTSAAALARFFARLTDMRLAGRGCVTSAPADARAEAEIARRVEAARRRIG
jgi:hypothetical protein